MKAYQGVRGLLSRAFRKCLWWPLSGTLCSTARLAHASIGYLLTKLLRCTFLIKKIFWPPSLSIVCQYCIFCSAFNQARSLPSSRFSDRFGRTVASSYPRSRGVQVTTTANNRHGRRINSSLRAGLATFLIYATTELS